MLFLTWPRFPLLFMENKCLISFCLTPSCLLSPYPLAPCKTVATLLWCVTVPKSQWWPVCSWLRLLEPLWGGHMLCCPLICRIHRDTMGGRERREGKSQRGAEVLAEMTWLDFATVREQGLPPELIFQDESVCLSAQEICSSLQIRVIRSSSLLKNFQWLFAAKRTSSHHGWAFKVPHHLLPAFFATSPSPLLCNSPFQITGSPKCLWHPFPRLCSRWSSGKSFLLILRWPARGPGLGTHIGLQKYWLMKV